MRTLVKNGSYTLVILFATVFAGCEKPSSEETNNVTNPRLMPEYVIKHPPMAATPPIPLAELEAKIEKLCSIDLDQWQRTYSYTWLRRGFSDRELSFLLLKGPYADLRPQRSWRDVLEVAKIDDRPGIHAILGIMI